MSEVVLEMNVRVTKVLREVPDCLVVDEKAVAKHEADVISNLGYDNVIVDDVKVFELGGEQDERSRE